MESVNRKQRAPVTIYSSTLKLRRGITLLSTLLLVTIAAKAINGQHASDAHLRPSLNQTSSPLCAKCSDAAQIDDLSGFKAFVTPDYYAFDGGVRFLLAESLIGLIKQAHEKGNEIRMECHRTGSARRLLKMPAG